MADKTNFQAFVATLKPKPFSLYLLADQEPYFREKAFTMLKNLILGEDEINYFLLDGDSLTPEGLADHLNSPPLFAEHKLIHIRRFRPSRFTEDNAELYLKALEDIPDYAVVFIELSEPATKRAKNGGEGAAGAKLIRTLSKNNPLFSFETPTPEELSRIVIKLFHENEKDISPSDVSYFLSRCQGNDTLSIIGEAKKLFSLPHREIKRDDIDSLVSLSPDAASYLISNALFDNHLNEALSIYRSLIKKGVGEYQLSTTIHNDMRRYYAIRIGMISGCSDNELINLLSITDKRLFVLKRIVGRVNPIRLRRCVSLCAENEHTLRTTGNDGVLSTESLLIKLSVLLGNTR